MDNYLNIDAMHCVATTGFTTLYYSIHLIIFVLIISSFYWSLHVYWFISRCSQRLYGFWILLVVARNDSTGFGYCWSLHATALQHSNDRPCRDQHEQ